MPRFSKVDISNLTIAAAKCEARMMRTKIRTLIFLLSSLCLSVSAGISEAQQRLYFGHTTDPTPVRISIYDQHAAIQFEIPKVYMIFSENWKGGLQSAVTLEVIYPSMDALSAEGSHASAGASFILSA